jgi:streptogramin lyase
VRIGVRVTRRDISPKCGGGRFTVAIVKGKATFAGLVALALAGATPAHAGVVAEVKLGSSLGDLVVGSDGGAWVFIERPGPDAVGRAEPDGRFRTAATDEFGLGAALGPDGNAWFRAGPGRFLRADARDTLDTIGEDDSRNPLQSALAIGPDGTLWSPTADFDGFWHIQPDGTRTRVPVALGKPCDVASDLVDMAAATDGAMWLGDPECARLIRVDQTGARSIDIGLEPHRLAADRAGGAWVSGDVEPSVAHVDAAGAVTLFDVPDSVGFTDDVAVAPDGSAWFASPRCRLLRVTPEGRISSSTSPIPANELGFDPAGGLWLKSRGRLAHLAPGERGGACDRRAPSVRISPRGSTISLRRLRRLGGFTITVREPADIYGLPVYFDGVHRYGRVGPSLDRIVRAPRGERLRYRVSARRLRGLARQLAAGRKPSLRLDVVARDIEGNSDVATVQMRIRR